MSDQWKPGDRARIDNHGGSYHGRGVTVSEPCDVLPKCWVCTVDDESGFHHFAERIMVPEPIRDPVRLDPCEPEPVEQKAPADPFPIDSLWVHALRKKDVPDERLRVTGPSRLWYGVLHLPVVCEGDRHNGMRFDAMAEHLDAATPESHHDGQANTSSLNRSRPEDLRRKVTASDPPGLRVGYFIGDEKFVSPTTLTVLEGVGRWQQADPMNRRVKLQVQGHSVVAWITVIRPIQTHRVKFCKPDTAYNVHHLLCEQIRVGAAHPDVGFTNGGAEFLLREDTGEVEL